MVTNDNKFPGYRVVKSHGIVTARDLCSNFALYGSKPGEEKFWSDVFSEVVAKLEQQAHEVGGNAVICVREEIFNESKALFNTLAIVLVGTAVTVEEESSPAPAPAQSAHNMPSSAAHPAPVSPESSDDGYIICPSCGKRQKAGRTCCYECGVSFSKPT